MKSKNFTRQLDNPPFINSSACIVGPKEGEGPMKETYDLIVDDEYWAEDTWEKSESKFVKKTYNKIITMKGYPKGSSRGYAFFHKSAIRRFLNSNFGCQ